MLVVTASSTCEALRMTLMHVLQVPTSNTSEPSPLQSKLPGTLVKAAKKVSPAVVHIAQHSTAHVSMHAPEAATAAADTELSAAAAPHAGGAGEARKVDTAAAQDARSPLAPSNASAPHASSSLNALPSSFAPILTAKAPVDKEVPITSVQLPKLCTGDSVGVLHMLAGERAPDDEVSAEQPLAAICTAAKRPSMLLQQGPVAVESVPALENVQAGAADAPEDTAVPMVQGTGDALEQDTPSQLDGITVTVAKEPLPSACEADGPARRTCSLMSISPRVHGGAAPVQQLSGVPSVQPARSVSTGVTPTASDTTRNRRGAAKRGRANLDAGTATAPDTAATYRRTTCKGSSSVRPKLVRSKILL